MTAIPETSADPIRTTYTRESCDPHVAVASGYGVSVSVHRGQLVIKDGIGRTRRTRSYLKADRMLKRIVVCSSVGYISLESLKWCSEHGISIVSLNPVCELIAHYAPDETTHDPGLLRLQVYATGADKEVEIVREIESRKLTGQSVNSSDLLHNREAALSISRYHDRVIAAETVKEMQELEGWAARDYFAAWSGAVAIQWDRQSVRLVPTNWLGYSGRGTLTNKSKHKQNASDPVNAILNYAYTLGYTECRIACISHGLDPRLGYLHSDKPGRDSLALDILETIRPIIDAYVIGLVKSREFSHRQFSEPYGYVPGTCRLVAPLTHEIGEASYAWHEPASATVKVVKGILTGRAGKRGDHIASIVREKLEFTSVAITAGEVLPDKLWSEIEALVPAWPDRVSRRPPISDRTMVAAMLYMERAQRPWAYLPDSFGISHRTMRDRRRMWQRSGHWTAIQEKIRELASR